MEKQILSEDKNIKRILVKIPSDEVKKTEDYIVREVNKEYSFEGFRKGKAPKQIIKIRLGENFNNWLNDTLLEKAVQDIEKEEKFLFSPTVESTANENGNVEFEILVHAYPKLLNTKFEEIVVEAPKSDKVVEKFIEDKIKTLLESNAIVEPKEGKAEVNDFIRVKYTVLNEEGKELQKDKENEYVLYEDDKRPMVTELIGKEKGDVVEYEKEFENKKYKYIVTLEEVYNRTIPELTDEFLREIGSEFNSISELKAKYEEEGKEVFSKWNEDFIRNYIIGEIPSKTEVDLSEETKEFYVKSYMESMEKEGKLEEELAKYDNDKEKLIEEVKKTAERWVKELVVVDTLTKEHNLEVKEEEIMESIKAIAQMWYMPVERAKETIYSNQKLLNDVVWDVLKSKVADIIKEKVTIKEVEEKEETK